MEYNCSLLSFLKYATKMTSHQEVSSLAMEGLDIINVPEYGVLLAADISRCIGAVCVLQVMGGKEVYLLYKL